MSLKDWFGKSMKPSPKTKLNKEDIKCQTCADLGYLCEECATTESTKDLFWNAVSGQPVRMPQVSDFII